MALRVVAGADWVQRAQNARAAEVVEETRSALAQPLGPRDRAHALYTQALALARVGAGVHAVTVARELCLHCREHGLAAHGVQGRALLADLLRRNGQLEQAVEQLADAVALEPGLDVHDPDVQLALGNLASALRQAGVFEEARRVEARLAAVEPSLTRHQRVARWSNLASEHAVQAMAAARRPPFRADARLLRQAVEEIGKALLLCGDGVYEEVVDEADVLGALVEAVTGDPHEGLRRLQLCRSVLRRGAEASTAQLLWGAAQVRALRRLARAEEAATAGRDLLAVLKGSDEATLLVLAYEVMRAEHPDAESPGSGTATYVEIAEERLTHDGALVAALFRARVDLQRGADERRVLAREASVDPLTGLVNRRGAAAAIAGAARRRPGDPVALLLVDLDGFKDVNDVQGHLAGDSVLQRVATALRTAARTQDVIARWGGDEFLVVAELEVPLAVALADRLREAVRDSGDPSGGAVTASVGVAVRHDHLDDETWLRRADEAMYRAKRSGGDATVVG